MDYSPCVIGVEYLKTKKNKIKQNMKKINLTSSESYQVDNYYLNELGEWDVFDSFSLWQFSLSDKNHNLVADTNKKYLPITLNRESLIKLNLKIIITR